MPQRDRITQRFYGLFNDSFPPIIDGVTLAVENYATWLLKRGFPTCVVTPWNPECQKFPYEVIRYFSLPIRSRKPYRYGYPKLDPFIWKRLRNTPFEIVHSHCPFSSGRLAVYVKKHQKVPLIGTFHSKFESDLKHSFKFVPWMVPIIMRRILDFFNACDEVWIPQAQVEEIVRQYGYRGKLEVVENGIDYNILGKNELIKKKKESKKKLGIKENELSLLFVGQHIWEKGLDVILDTLEHLNREEAHFKMNFVGTGYAVDDLKRRITSLGLTDKVKINGIVSDREMLSDFYAAADLFLFPSMYDNAPLVLREAASFATPGILPSGATASGVIKNGVNGFLALNNGQSYADLILSLAEKPEEILNAGMNASVTIVRSWENVVEEVIDRYATIIKQKKYGKF